MKVLVTGDWHIGVTQYGVADENGVNSRIADLEDVLMRVIKYARSDEIDLFVVAGDVFHTNRPTAEEQRVFWRILQECQASNFITRIIIGNHDYNSKLGASHALKLFQDIVDGDKIKIFDETTWEVLPFGDLFDPLLVCWYPYRGSPPDWAEAARYGNVHATALVCHSHLEGAVVGAEPFEIQDDRATKFKDLPVDFVWSGHFHKPQLLCERPLAFYPGSIQCVDFNERNDAKGVVVVDTLARSHECVGFAVRRFAQIDLKDRANLEPKDLENLDDAIVKVTVELPESRSAEFNEAEIRKAVIEAGAHNVATVNLNVIREAIVRDAAVRLESGLVDNFKRFTSSQKYGDIVDEVNRRGLEIIEQCVSSA